MADLHAAVYHEAKHAHDLAISEYLNAQAALENSRRVYADLQHRVDALREDFAGDDGAPQQHLSLIIERRRQATRALQSHTQLARELLRKARRAGVRAKRLIIQARRSGVDTSTLPPLLTKSGLMR